MQERPFALSALLIVATIAAGLAIRLAPLEMPNALVKYGGSLLWAMMIYWMVSAARPHWRLARSALVSSAVALCVELFKLYHTPSLDAFRFTLPGKLLLGRIFSFWALLAYTIAILSGALADRAIRSRMSRPASADLRAGRDEEQVRSRASVAKGDPLVRRLSAPHEVEAVQRDLDAT